MTWIHCFTVIFKIYHWKNLRNWVMFFFHIQMFDWATVLTSSPLTTCYLHFIFLNIIHVGYLRKFAVSQNSIPSKHWASLLVFLLIKLLNFWFVLFFWYFLVFSTFHVQFVVGSRSPCVPGSNAANERLLLGNFCTAY